METIYTSREELKYTLEELYESCKSNDTWFSVDPKERTITVYADEPVFVKVIDIADEADLEDMIFGKKEGK